jgi:hypothetical protein
MSCDDDGGTTAGPAKRKNNVSDATELQPAKFFVSLSFYLPLVPYVRVAFSGQRWIAP